MGDSRQSDAHNPGISAVGPAVSQGGLHVERLVPDAFGGLDNGADAFGEIARAQQYDAPLGRG
jgi:hypothetical protein